MLSYKLGESPWISIHALREEGDQILSKACHYRYYFYPRPPRGGRLKTGIGRETEFLISIHALREEGDLLGIDDTPSFQ